MKIVFVIIIINNLERYESCKPLLPGFDGRKVSLFDNSIIGSCNGLVCFLSNKLLEGYPVFIICNPVTGEYINLQRNRSLHPQWQDPVGGFGYIISTNEYKVVRFYRSDYEFDRKIHAHVYTLGSQVGWRIIDDKIPIGRYSKFVSSGIFANGAIHWLETHNNGIAPEVNIVAFDLADEKFKSVTSPSREKRAVPKRALLGGNLCVVFHLRESIDIWAFKKNVNNKRVGLLPSKKKMIKERLPINRPKKKARQMHYDRTWRWSKEFSIPCKRPWWYNPFAITENNEVLIWDKDTTTPQSIHCYDPNNTSTLHKSSDAYLDTYGSCLQLTPHMNTLVSLKDLGVF
ncbi:F-box protein At3g07870-like [Papaver somniferum]|uniref:F-box protein At3g07870-like n=1 Tax=Papaver somniferum TaxID=3469 RepID=UPI000E6F5AB5|nr:F-box protein At3g07870-like [Papaver somniferum]